MTVQSNNSNKCLILSFLTSVLFMLLLAAALGYYATVYYMRNDGVVDVCYTDGCIEAAEEFLKSVDTSVDPCQDFFNFSCGKYIKDTLTPSGRASPFSSSDAKFQLKVKELLEGNQAEDENFLKAQKYYAVCMNTTLRENITAFTEDLEFLGGWPLLETNWNDSDWMTIMMKMISIGYDESTLLSLTFAQDFLNRSIVRIMINQPDLDYEKENYVNSSDNSLLLENYEDFILAMAKALSTEQGQFNNSSVVADVNEAFAIETKLAEMSKSSTYFVDDRNVYHPMTFGTLQKLAPELDWRRFLQLYINESISDDEIIIVPVIDVIANITNYLSQLNSSFSGRRALANYMIYRMVLTSSKDLNTAMNHIYTDHDASAPLYMWNQCVTSTLSNFKFSVIAAYQKLYFDDTKRNDILYLVDQLKKQLAAMLKATSWLDEETRAAAIHKVNSIEAIVGFPTDFQNDSLVDDWYKEYTVGDDHFQNTLEGNTFMLQKYISSFHKPVDNSSWLYLPTQLEDTNAFYEVNVNKIFITIGMSSNSFYYSESVPMYVNYGRLGIVIGHELAHSIDEGGAKYDEFGNERNWWQNGTLEKYENISQCIINLFSSFVDNTTGLQINGNRTEMETTADSVGVREAYGAYLEYSKDYKELPLPAMPYTNNQMFWISYATLWCDKTTFGQQQNRILYDEHPPPLFRVDGVASNNADFANDFQCNLGTPMNPTADKCVIFGQ